MEKSKERTNNFLKSIWNTRSSLKTKAGKIIFYANFVFIEDFLNDLKYYMEEYGIEIVVRFIDIDLEMINLDVKRKSEQDYEILSEIWIDVLEFAKEDIYVIVSSIKEGYNFHTEEDFEYLIRNYPELLV